MMFSLLQNSGRANCVIASASTGYGDRGDTRDERPRVLKSSQGSERRSACRESLQFIVMSVMVIISLYLKGFA